MVRQPTLVTRSREGTLADNDIPRPNWKSPWSLLRSLRVVATPDAGGPWCPARCETGWPRSACVPICEEERRTTVSPSPQLGSRIYNERLETVTDLLSFQRL